MTDDISQLDTFHVSNYLRSQGTKYIFDKVTNKGERDKMNNFGNITYKESFSEKLSIIASKSL